MPETVPVSPKVLRASKIPRTGLRLRTWIIRGDVLASIGGFLLLFSLLLPWYYLGEAGEIPQPGPIGMSLGAATAVVVTYVMFVFLGAGTRNPVVIAVFAIAQMAFVGFLLLQALADPPALMSDPCLSRIPVSNYCDYAPPIHGPDLGLFVASGAAFLSFAGGLREAELLARRKRLALAVSARSTP